MAGLLKKILPDSFGLPRRIPDIDLDFSPLETQRQDMDQRIERMKTTLEQATLNGEEEWMLCLTKKSGVCREEKPDE